MPAADAAAGDPKASAYAVTIHCRALSENARSAGRSAARCSRRRVEHDHQLGDAEDGEDPPALGVVGASTAGALVRSGPPCLLRVEVPRAMVDLPEDVRGQVLTELVSSASSSTVPPIRSLSLRFRGDVGYTAVQRSCTATPGLTRRPGRATQCSTACDQHVERRVLARGRRDRAPSRRGECHEDQGRRRLRGRQADRDRGTRAGRARATARC